MILAVQENEDKPGKKSENTAVNNDILTVGKKLMEKSSIYPVSQVASVESFSRRIWWIFVLVVGLFGCSYQTIQFLFHYLEYPVVMDVMLEYKTSMEFPAVTICNLNRIRNKFRQCMEKNIQCNESDPTYKNWFVKNGASLPISERRSVGSCFNYLSGLQDKNMDAKMRFLINYTKSDANQRKNFGHLFRYFIVNCSFNENPCKRNYFSPFQSLRYGNCFTFNKKNNSRVLNTSVVDMYGLDVLLDTEHDEYVDVTSSVGAKVIIHDPNEDPNPDEEGITISTAFETSVSITQKSIKRLPPPYRDKCINYESQDKVRGKSQSDCVRQCIQELNLAHCSCIDPTLPLIDKANHCNMSNSTEACCLDNVLIRMQASGQTCNCPLPCLSTSYNVITSTAVLNSRLGIGTVDDNWYEYYGHALTEHARLKVFYSSLRSTVYEQRPMFQNSELFSNLGSQMSLWLGLSLFAIFELIEDIIYLCNYCCRRNRANSI